MTRQDGEHRPPARESSRTSFTDRQLSGLAALVLFLLLVGAASVAGATLVTDLEQFREDVVAWGALGVLVALGLVIVHAVLPYPAEILSLACGFAYGFLPALALMVVLWTVSCLVAYWLAWRFGRPLIRRLVDHRALSRTEAKVAPARIGTLLALRVIPVVPYNLVSYPCGMFGVPLRRFTWTTAVGLLPQLAVVTYAGSQAVELSSTDARIWAIGLAWLALILAGRWLAARLDPADGAAV